MDKDKEPQKLKGAGSLQQALDKAVMTIPASTCQNQKPSPLAWPHLSGCASCGNFEAKIAVPDRDAMGIRFYELGASCGNVESFYNIDLNTCTYKIGICHCGSIKCIDHILETFKAKHGGREECNCKNYVKVKLPKVTASEVGQRYWKLQEPPFLNPCTALKESYGFTGNTQPWCCSDDNRSNYQCASHGCIQLITEKINEGRGY